MKKTVFLLLALAVVAAHQVHADSDEDEEDKLPAECPANYRDKVAFCQACMYMVRAAEVAVAPALLRPAIGDDLNKAARKQLYGHVTEFYENICHYSTLSSEMRQNACNYLMENHDEDFSEWYMQRYITYLEDPSVEDNMEPDDRSLSVEAQFCKERTNFCPEGEGDMNRTYKSLAVPGPENDELDIPHIVLFNYKEKVVERKDQDIILFVLDGSDTQRAQASRKLYQIAKEIRGEIKSVPKLAMYFIDAQHNDVEVFLGTEEVFPGVILYPIHPTMERTLVRLCGPRVEETASTILANMMLKVVNERTKFLMKSALKKIEARAEVEAMNEKLGLNKKDEEDDDDDDDEEDEDEDEDDDEEEESDKDEL